MDEEEPRETSALLELVEIERRLEADLAAAAIEAEQILEAARREAHVTHTHGDAELEAGLDRLRQSIERESEATLRDLEARARAQEAHFQAVDETALGELARGVVEGLLGIGSQP